MRRNYFVTETGESPIEVLITVALVIALLAIASHFLWPSLPASVEKIAFSSVIGWSKNTTVLNENTGSISFYDVYVQGLSDENTIVILTVKPDDIIQVKTKIDPNLEGTAISTKFSFGKRLLRNKGRTNYIEVEELTVWVQNQIEKEQWDRLLAKLEDDRNTFLRFKLEKELSAKKLRKVTPF